MQLRDSAPAWLRVPRTSTWLMLAVVLVATAAVMAYWLDRALFPYARPNGYLARNWRLGSTEPTGEADHPIAPSYVIPCAAAMLRPGVIVAAVISGVAAGI